MKIKQIPFIALALTLTGAFSQCFIPVFSQGLETPDKLASETTTVKSGKKGGHRKDPLGLSDAQKEKMLTLRNQMKDKVQPKIAELSSHKRALQDLLTRESLDKAAILKEQEQINSLAGEIASVKLSYRIDSSENLTPEQRQTLRKRMASKGKGMGGRKHAGKHKRAAQPASTTQAEMVEENKEQV
ncbi:MAG TPA: periplasmic heavy metal sensor [Candidatus Obscuribacter sp.]|nr:periplasmic heavy metal sensor [Candidatus Obscuribacter sp.]